MRLFIAIFALAAIFISGCNNKPAGPTEAEVKDTIQKTFMKDLVSTGMIPAESLESLVIDSFVMVTAKEQGEVVIEKVQAVFQQYDTMSTEGYPAEMIAQLEAGKAQGRHFIDSLKGELPKKDDKAKDFYKVFFTVKVKGQMGQSQTISEVTFFDKNYKQAK